ncbi:MAG TPA: pirin family protein [Verrucomicrobiae bacterium]|nr:pirin family protein [Verrucomicrobiae bacterium]
MKKLSFKQRKDEVHWVGDGFPVRTVFSYNDLGAELSPFLLLDYAGPVNFPPSEHRRGVGDHPHRGFETVTVVYQGEVEHRDSSGGGGIIRSGEVQWMTAGSGIVHQEYHGGEFAKRGGPFEMVQLWVNLPAKDKMTPPGYQAIVNSEIPQVDLPSEAGSLRVIAGSYNGVNGPARTRTPMDVWDVGLNANQRAVFEVTAGDTAAVLILKGRASVADGEAVGEASLAVLERDGEQFSICAVEDTTMLILSGQPIDEPIVGYGPFVMNTSSEIAQAVADFNSGRMGRIAAS